MGCEGLRLGEMLVCEVVGGFAHAFGFGNGGKFIFVVPTISVTLLLPFRFDCDFEIVLCEFI